jgi:RND family efflux transporter MFP subunit
MRPPIYAIVSPTRGDAAEIVYATGVVEPQTWAKVGPLTRDRIVEICDCEGQPVERGQVLARLDDSEERATLAELQARLDLAVTELERLSKLSAQSYASIQDAERGQSEVDQITALIAGQRAKLDSLVLRAPLDGMVLRQDGEIGEIAETGAVLFWVGEEKPLIVTAEVNEEDIPHIETGQRVLIRADAFPDRVLEAKVGVITPKGDPVTKTYRVRFALPDDTPVRIGMTVDVNVVVGVSENALLLPAAAVNGTAVYVVALDGTATRRNLEIGIRGETSVEVKSGVSDSDRVISPYPENLRDATRIRPQTS